MDNATLASLTITPVAAGYEIRLPPQAFTAFWAAFAIFVFLPGLGRIAFRLYVSKKLFIDDYLVLFAIICLAPAAALTHSIWDLIYEQVWTGVGWSEPPPNFYPEMLVFEQRILASSALLWAALYAIKFAFLIFFQKLISRVQRLIFFWWATVAFTATCALVSIPLGFLVCAHLTSDYMTWCPITSQLASEKVYLITTCVMDVATDILILVIPMLLLWPLQLAIIRKLALLGMMSLSIFMIVIAIVRVAGAQLPNGVVDTSWLVFWSGMESAIAVLMVSMLVLKSMFSVEVERRSERQRRLDAEKGLTSLGSSSSPSTIRWSWRSSLRRSPIGSINRGQVGANSAQPSPLAQAHRRSAGPKASDDQHQWRQTALTQPCTEVAEIYTEKRAKHISSQYLSPSTVVDETPVGTPKTFFIDQGRE